MMSKFAPPRNKVCADCAAEFTTTGNTQIRCVDCGVARSAEMRRARARRRYHEGRLRKRKSPTHIACDTCGVRVKWAPRKRFCKPCAAQAKRATEHARAEAYRERRAEISRAWAARNPDKVRSRKEAYRRATADRPRTQATRQRVNHWERVKRATDPVFALNSRMRCAVRRGLKRGKMGRSWRDLTGYTAEVLRVHLERQFKDQMSWDNYGSHWHIDHIVPLAAFAYETPDCEGFKQAWALTNLRPLRAHENMSKRAKRTHLI